MRDAEIIRELISALEDIKSFGFVHTGCGYSCAEKAEEILNKYYSKYYKDK